MKKTNIMMKKKIHKTGGQILANVIETENEINFGSINIKEIWLCEFRSNKETGYYNICHKAIISDEE